MTQQIATDAYIAWIAGLFFLDRDTKERTSKALWIPVIWLLIIGSRPVSAWFQSGPTIATAAQYADGSPLDAAVFGVLVAACAVTLCSRSSQVKRFLRVNLPLVLFFSYCALSVVWSDYSFVALKRWVKSVADMGMVLIVLTDPDPLAATKRLFSRAAFVLLPLSLLFIKYYPNLGRSYDRWTWIPMYGGVTEFKNELGMICLVLGLSSVWSLIEAYENRRMPHRIRHMVAHGNVVAAAIWLLFTADSMTSLSCFLMASAVMIMTVTRWVAKRPRIIHLLVGSMVALSLCALFFDSGGGMVESLGRNSSLTGRTGIWKAVLSIHINPLLGAGFETFWLGERLQRVWDLSVKGIQEAHNGYLELYLNLGWFGVVFLAGLIGTGYRNTLNVLRRDPHAGRLRVAFFTAAVIYSLTEAGFRMMSPIWIAFLLAITAVPLPVQIHRKRQRKIESPMTPAEFPRESEDMEIEDLVQEFG
ncbi:MAG: O-antigen ligase family protein [Acidobacteriaceae bacterium]